MRWAEVWEGTAKKMNYKILFAKRHHDAQFYQNAHLEPQEINYYTMICY
jgi:hypothetical protein